MNKPYRGYLRKRYVLGEGRPHFSDDREVSLIGKDGITKKLAIHKPWRPGYVREEKYRLVLELLK